MWTERAVSRTVREQEQGLHDVELFRLGQVETWVAE